MKARLSLLYFLQFAVWGCYLTCFGQLLGAGGLGRDISWFYAAIGIVSILTPPLLGRLADRLGRPEQLLALCHLGASAAMLAMWAYASAHPHLSFGPMLALYLLFLALYMPTMALANTSTFGLLGRAGLDPAAAFPAIRVWGTVGFVAAMWFVNSAYWADGRLGFALSDADVFGRLRFQYNAMQLLCSAIMGAVAAAYAFTLPKSLPMPRSESAPAAKSSLMASASGLLRAKGAALFLVFAVLAGVCLQISNGFVTPYITHFSGMPQYAGSLASGNATMLFSLSQISEACCVFLVGLCLRRRGIRLVFAIGLLAWSLRFALLGVGNPTGGLWALVGSMLVYGIAFNFITIGGHLYMQRIAPEGMKGFAQGTLMLFSNGIGATSGIILAGGVVNHWCSWQSVEVGAGQARLFMGEWAYPWAIFAAYALLVMAAWLLTSCRKKN